MNLDEMQLQPDTSYTSLPDALSEKSVSQNGSSVDLEQHGVNAVYGSISII